MNSLLRSLADMGTEIFDILFPRVCVVCGKPLVAGEDVMCLGCLVDLPRTGQHRRQPNDIHTRLISLHAPLERCASLFHYHKDNPYSTLVKAAKYRSRPSIGRHLGAMFADELKADGFFDGIDLILPVPIHFLRLLTRGYNQTIHIAQGVSKVTGIPVGDNLYAPRPHAAQARKRAEGRRINATGAFAVRNPEQLQGKHLLVVDDVITTGSTMVSALDTIKYAEPTVRLSVLSLALTY